MPHERKGAVVSVQMTQDTIVPKDIGSHCHNLLNQHQVRIILNIKTIDLNTVMTQSNHKSTT
jgi:hypothetical protein